MPRNFDSRKNAEAIATVNCPKCKSPAGHKCTTYNGRVMGFVHAERMAQYNVNEKAKSDADEAKREFAEATRMADKIVEQVAVGTSEVDRDLKFRKEPPNAALVRGMLGRTIEEAEERSRTIQSVEGGIRLLIGLEGLDWTIRRLAEMIVDGELQEFYA